jgi:hypothetical protein
MRQRKPLCRIDEEVSLALTAAHGIQHVMWRVANWMLALGRESMLAAQTMS